MRNAYASSSFPVVLLVVLGCVLYLSVTFGWRGGITGVAVCLGAAVVSFSFAARDLIGADTAEGPAAAVEETRALAADAGNRGNR